MGRSDWPIVVGGCHRSGTSLLRRILDAHPRIHCGPELTFFRDFYGDYGDDPLKHLRFTTTARALLPEEELLTVLGRSFLALHDLAAASAGKARWADKSPDNVLYSEQWQRLLGDSWLMIHVVRNPLDTVASMDARFPLTLPSDLEGRVAFYRRYTEAGLSFGERNPDRYCTLVYEELCEAPEVVVRNLMAWVGERPGPLQLTFNAVRHQVGLEDPNVRQTDKVHGESVGRWRSILSKDEAAVVWSATRDVWSRVDPEGRYTPVRAAG